MADTHKRQLKGTIVSDKMDKTVVVKVERVKMHRLYHRHYKQSKRFKAHDPKNEYHIGDHVLIEETRPLSRQKRWRVISKI